MIGLEFLEAAYTNRNCSKQNILSVINIFFLQILLLLAVSFLIQYFLVSVSIAKCITKRFQCEIIFENKIAFALAELLRISREQQPSSQCDTDATVSMNVGRVHDDGGNRSGFMSWATDVCFAFKWYCL